MQPERGSIRHRGRFLCALCDRTYRRSEIHPSTRSLAVDDRLIATPPGRGVTSPPDGYAVTTADWFATASPDAVRTSAYRTVHQAELVCRKLPRTVDGSIHRNFLNRRRCVAPATFAARLSNARTWGPEGAIITSDNVLLGDLSNRPWTRPLPLHPIFSHLRLPEPREFRGTLCVLTARGAHRNYGHWMLDLLPRLEIARRSGLRRALDSVLVNRIDAAFQRETLERLGLSAKQIVVANETSHIGARTLLATSLPRANNIVPTWVGSFLRRTFLTNPGVRKNPSKRRIYITRRESRWRRVVNEYQVINALDRRGFECIDDLGKMALEDHVSLFQAADVIVCAHGAGMVNTVFCKPGAKVVELIPADWVDPFYWALNCISRTDYGYVLCPSRRGGELRPPMERDILVPVATLTSLLDTMEA